MHRPLIAILALLAVAQPALAQEDNLVFIEQDGADNSGRVDQAGARNQLGTQDDPALQSGYYNLLELTQTGSGNQVGMFGDGVDQDGFAATPSVFNRISVTQTGDGHIVGEMRQAAQGGIPDGANRAFLTQQGGDGNVIGTVLQDQADDMPGQVATLIQTGDANLIVRVEQSSLTPANNGENVIRAEFVGTGNGTVALSGWALNSGAESGALIQRIGDDRQGANGNFMDLQVLGDYNRFGIYQGGRLNSVGQLTINGDGNQLGVHQDGLENDLTSSIIQGDGNDIGVEQWGTNTAYLDLPGDSDDNGISIFQSGANDIEVLVDGARNLVIANQDYDGANGGRNSADIDVTGDENRATLQQAGENTATVRLDGDRNNAAGFSAGLNAPAGLEAGLIVQTGRGNSVGVSVTGDRNRIGTAQSGLANLLTAVVSGDDNEAAILQAGNGNSATLRQQGVGNSAVISQ